MRYLFIPAVALILTASSASAADIMSCSYDMPMPPPPPPPGAMPMGKNMPPASMGQQQKPQDGDSQNIAGMMPPPPPPPPAPTVVTMLKCMHGTEKMEGNLAQLTSQGWNLQTAISLPGSATFYLTK